MKQALVVFFAMFLLVPLARADEAPAAETASAAPDLHHFTLLAEPVGYGPTASITRGVSAGWFITQQDLLSLEYTVGWGINFDEWSSDSHVKTSSIGVMYRHFVSRSFYIKAGGLYRTIDWAGSYTDDSNAVSTLRTLNGNSTAIEVAVGNRWNIHHFTIGADWIGYVQPIATRVVSENYATGGAKDQYLTGGTFEFCRLSLGVVF